MDFGYFYYWQESRSLGREHNFARIILVINSLICSLKLSMHIQFMINERLYLLLGSKHRTSELNVESPVFTVRAGCSGTGSGYRWAIVPRVSHTCEEHLCSRKKWEDLNTRNLFSPHLLCYNKYWLNKAKFHIVKCLCKMKCARWICYACY